MTMDTQELNQLWQTYQLKVTDEIAKSPEVLFCNGSAIGTLGNFSATTGKAKSKKTFNVISKQTKLQTFSYSELTPEQHRQALEMAFSDGAIKGCQNYEDSIKRAYAACGFPYGDGKVTKLKSFLMNKRMVGRENGTYSYNPDFYY